MTGGVKGVSGKRVGANFVDLLGEKKEKKMVYKKCSLFNSYK